MLVPGFWLGAWAWDEVAGQLRDEGLHVAAVTLPGLDSVATDRSGITLEDHVDTICAAVEAAADAAGSPAVLAVHSGASVSGYAASDRIPDRIAAMVYVDTIPGADAINPEFAEVELALWSPEELAERESLDGLSAEQLATFRERAIPQPGGTIREAPALGNVGRRDLPSTVICTAWPAAEFQRALAGGEPWLAELGTLTKLTWLDLPTSHWPMWSRPADLAALLSGIAKGVTSA